MISTSARTYLKYQNYQMTDTSIGFVRGFEITPCNVASGWEKGRVENGVGYVKKNFLTS